MAEDSDIKPAETAEKAYAAAAAAAEAKVRAAAEPVKIEFVEPVPVAVAKVEVPVAAPVKPKAEAKPKAPVKIKSKGPAKQATVVTKAPPAVVKAPPAVAKVPARKKAVKILPAPRRIVARKITKPVISGEAPEQSIAELKEKIMANAKKTTPDYSKIIKDVQGKAKAAYAKGSEVTGEVTSFTKGNVEAVVASGKILATGAKTFGKDYVAESKGAFETLTGDLKAFAAVKSPTELFQLQGKLARRNFDAAVAFSSKTSESLVKLANEAFAPISNRVSIAVDKVSKAA